MENHMNRVHDTTANSNYDNARDRRADSVRFGEVDTDHNGLAGNQANKGMLTEAVSEKLGGSRRQAARILDAVLDSISELLHEKNRVALKGFGTFESKIRKGRAYKHPVTGESIEVADKQTILFKPSKNLIEKVNPAESKKGTETVDNPTPAYRG